MKHDKPSATASLVLKAVLFAAHDPAQSGLVAADAARWSRSIAHTVVRFPKFFIFSIQNKFFRWVLTKIEEVFNPGFILHVAARKAFIDKLGRQAIESGVSQVVVIGAGYDTFGLRAAATHSHVICFEIDHPSTQKVKIAAIGLNEAPRNLYFIPADLSARSVREVLGSHPRFDSKLKTLIVIEGVLMYLPAEAVKSFFKDVVGLFQDGLMCIFTFMDRRDGNIQFQTAHPLVNWWLRQKHEQFLWGIERDRISAYLHELGFVKADTYGKSEFTKAFFQNSLPMPKLAEGEYVCLASR